MSECPKCKRPSMDPNSPESFKAHALEVCMYPGGATCLTAGSAYRRGVRDMLVAAKRTAEVSNWDGWAVATSSIDWTETDEEAAKLTGDVEHG